jgi:hypothetical protein
MEYAIGVLLTLVTVVVANRLITKQLKDKKTSVVKYSQSHIYSVIAPMMFGFGTPTPKAIRQSQKYQEEVYLRVVISDSKAYWIKENTFYTAEVVDGMVDKESTTEVDTMSMSDVELKKMMSIVETLREGDSNDNGSSRKP